MAAHVNMLVFPALALPLAGFLGLPAGQVLGMSFWMYFLFGVTALPWGVASDRWGAPPLLLLFHLGAAASCLAAAAWIDDPGRLTLALAGLGLFSGIYHPAGLGWISTRVERVSVGLGYNGMAGNLGIAAAPLLAGLLNWRIGPAAVYVTLAALNAVGAVLVLLAPRGGLHETEDAGTGGSRQRLGAFVVLLAAMLLGGVVYRGATVTVPALLELKGVGIYTAVSAWLHGGLSANVTATAIASAAYLVGMAGQMAGGHAAERLQLQRLYLGAHIVVAALAFALGAATEVPLALLVVAYFFFLLGMQPVENSLVARLTPPRFHHAAFGAKFVLTFGVGALAVKAVEAVERSQGLGAVFPLLGLVSAAMVAVILVLIRVAPRQAPARHGEPAPPAAPAPPA
jgi:predicted MFS family arabinose efflux permease